MYLWDLYLDARRFIEPTGFGRTPLGGKTLQAWSALKGIWLNAWEYDVLLACDPAFLNALTPPKAA